LSSILSVFQYCESRHVPCCDFLTPCENCDIATGRLRVTDQSCSFIFDEIQIQNSEIGTHDACAAFSGTMFIPSFMKIHRSGSEYLRPGQSRAPM
jgi:hypothetical protein